MKNLVLLLSVSTGLFLASCGNNSTKTGEADSAAAASANATTYNVDPSTSTVKWKGSKLFGMGEHTGTIAIQSGSFAVENGNVTAGNIAIDMKSIKVLGMDDAESIGKLIGHLSSEDFFNVAKYPTAKFEISKVEAKAEGESTHVVSGNLTLRDTALSISFPAMVHVDGDKAHIKGTVVIDRFNWGVNYDSEKHKGNLAEGAVKATKGGVVSKDIEIEFHLMGHK